MKSLSIEVVAKLSIHQILPLTIVCVFSAYFAVCHGEASSEKFSHYSAARTKISLTRTKYLSAAGQITKPENSSHLLIVDRKPSNHSHRSGSPIFNLSKISNSSLQTREERKHIRAKRQVGVSDLRITQGRIRFEGRVEVRVGGEWRLVCSDQWTNLEARVACNQAGLGFSRLAIKTNVYGGPRLRFLAAEVKCAGNEQALSECAIDQYGRNTACSSNDQVAGVVCATELPDLVPNATLITESIYLQDVPLFFLQCAIEENCVGSSALDTINNQPDWYSYTRRLMRFTLSTWNFGTATFYPDTKPEEWEYHACHMHYHSIQRFADYDLRDMTGKKVAAGSKASFCLEDVRCMPGKIPAFLCEGLQAQGISVGCADDYNHDIDCQWIDVTDIPPGLYVFKVQVNPLFSVGELDYSNNAVVCQLYYSGSSVNLQACILS